MLRLIRSRRRGERGATVVLVAVLMSAVLVVSAAFAVDLGQQRVLRRDVQAVADMVALDMVRLLDGRQAQAYSPAAFDQAKRESLARNDDALGGALADADVSWDFVKPASTPGAWTEIPNSATDIPTAIRVTASGEVDFAFGGVTGVASGDSTRTAIARSEESACFRLGSFVASLNTRQSALLNPILNALLGSNLDLDLVSYQGLAGANVSLLDLVEVGGLGVGSVEELLALDNVSVADLFVAAANVLDQQGNAAQADILRAIRVGLGTPSIALGDLVTVAPGSSAALAAGINVLDLITSAAFVANDDHAVSIPSLGINLPGVASTTASLSVIEPPRTACGRVGTLNETAQIRLTLTARINGQSLNIPALNTGVAVKPIDLAVTIDLGKAIARLAAVTCSATGPDSIKVDLSSAVVGGVNVSASAGVSARVDPVGGLLTSVLNLLGLGSLVYPPYLELDTTLAVTASTAAVSNYNKTVTVPIPGGYTVPEGSGTGMLVGAVALTPAMTTDLWLHYFEGILVLGSWKKRNLTDPLNTVFNGVVNPIAQVLLSSVLNPLVSTLQTALIDPLTALLGVQTGGARVFAVPTPTCGGPRLVG